MIKINIILKLDLLKETVLVTVDLLKLKYLDLDIMTKHNQIMLNVQLLFHHLHLQLHKIILLTTK